ncbi:transmembrane protein, putative [Bodo saltans]|uniref:Transmembrane protein, putative n=1 Tax=Bodo saltans TaxID=75058 RepID=A0A0S4JGS4_BODSA|nr:transmembrane protein, putative [Bodo saltans]|eukprot:CUG89128.1 transmembrane protein, putative [Bodo saltans]
MHSAPTEALLPNHSSQEVAVVGEGEGIPRGAEEEDVVVVTAAAAATCILPLPFPVTPIMDRSIHMRMHPPITKSFDEREGGQHVVSRVLHRNWRWLIRPPLGWNSSSEAPPPQLVSSNNWRGCGCPCGQTRRLERWH